MEVHQSRYGYKRLDNVFEEPRSRGAMMKQGGTNREMPAQAVAVGVYHFPSSHIRVIAAARPELWSSLYLP